jgi:hypothetical protein
MVKNLDKYLNYLTNLITKTMQIKLSPKLLLTAVVEKKDIKRLTFILKSQLVLYVAQLNRPEKFLFNISSIV